MNKERVIDGQSVNLVHLITEITIIALTVIIEQSD